MIASRPKARNETKMSDLGSAISDRISDDVRSEETGRRDLPAQAAFEVMVVAIGGFDSSGGAGVVRDFLTARTLGAAVRLIPSAWTEQSPSGVHAVEPRDPKALWQAVRSALADARKWADGSGAARQLDRSQGDATAKQRGLALKIGMLPDLWTARAVADAIFGFPGPVVLDPVLSASSGGTLFGGDPTELLGLGMRATLITPNAPEATALTGMAIRTLDDAARAGRAILTSGARAVLVKGGHIEGTAAVDVLVTARETGATARRFMAPRQLGHSVRGTGCALATAIAVGLGRGFELDEAIRGAKAWLDSARKTAVPVGSEWHLS
jgi:hydroxymethylpyrimidine/phosphomethylpyrimidine kinase